MQLPLQYSCILLWAEHGKKLCMQQWCSRARETGGFWNVATKPEDLPFSTSFGFDAIRRCHRGDAPTLRNKARPCMRTMYPLDVSGELVNAEAESSLSMQQFTEHASRHDSDCYCHTAREDHDAVSVGPKVEPGGQQSLQDLAQPEVNSFSKAACKRSLV